MAPSIVKGYRALPVVKDNPQWSMIELFDGFGAHLTNLNAHMQRDEAKILSIKEEGDSSSYNQAYDKHIAKSDKHHQRSSLTFMRGTKKRNSNLICQWDLIHCGVAAVRYTHHNPEVWISSFVSVNLCPMRMIPFADWCKKLEPFMQAADSFNLITQSQEIDEYTLLPALWQVMPPVDKKTAAAIVQQFSDNAWGLDCCSALITALKIKMSDLTTLQTCIFLAIDNPSHLDRGLKEVMDRIVAGDVVTADQAAIAAIEAIHEKANTGLHMMQCNPYGVKGMDLFEHHVAFHQQAYSKRESKHKISDSLACSPRTSHQRSLMSLDYYHLKIQGDLMADSREAGFSLQKAAQVRLDNIGLVKNHHIKLLEQRLELQHSIGRSEEIQKSSALEKDLAEMDRLSPLLFQTIAMYKAKIETTKRGFTKDSFKSILLAVFRITPPNSEKLSSKSEQLKLLQQQDKDNPGNMDSPVAANSTADMGSCCYSEQCKYTLATISPMPTSKGEYDDRCFTIGNIFGGSPSTL